MPGQAADTRHRRANDICVEASAIALRDGRTAAERFQIYEREVARLMAPDSAYWEPTYRSDPPASDAPPRLGFLFRI